MGAGLFLFVLSSFLILEEEAGKKHHHQVAVKETAQPYLSVKPQVRLEQTRLERPIT